MIYSELFGITSDNKKVRSFFLENANGMKAEILDYGCILRTLFVPDRNGVPRDIVLGYGDISKYENDGACFGAFVGRFANRIKNSSFAVNGKEYQLVPNEGLNHLHGVWKNTVFNAAAEGDSVVFTHHSIPSEEGYPGNVDVCVKYKLTDDNCLLMDISCTADEDTIINTTTHTYFNLNGHGSGCADEHMVSIRADYYLEPDYDSCPTGKLLPVDGTPLDLRTPVQLGTGRNSDYDLIRRVSGFDHCYAVEKSNAPSATAYAAESGIFMQMYSTQPGLQLYSGNFLDGTPSAKDGIIYKNGWGFALEPQQYPCSPNFKHFPSPVIKAGETKTDHVEYRFSVL